ncbi:unnamed protein product, partial [Chrysoparadoxa australica]
HEASKNDCSSFLAAARDGNLSTVTKLATLVPIDTKDDTHCQALHAAAKGGHASTIQKLVGLGASLHAK